MNMKERELINIEVDEVSFVNKPANDEAFLFFKLFGEDSHECHDCGYVESNAAITVCPECNGNLIKKVFIKENRTMEEILEIYKSLFGKDLTDSDGKLIEKANNLSDEAKKALKVALGMINKYKSEMPDELKEAIRVLAQYATGGKSPYPKPYKKEEMNEDLSKAGRVASKATLNKLSQIMEIIRSIMGSPEIKKDADGETEPSLNGIIEALSKFTKELTMNTEKEKKDNKKEEKEMKKKDKEDEEDNLETKILKQLKDISERLEVVEAAGGMKKSLPEEKKKEKEDEKDSLLWKSFKLDD